MCLLCGFIPYTCLKSRIHLQSYGHAACLCLLIETGVLQRNINLFCNRYHVQLLQDRLNAAFPDSMCLFIVCFCIIWHDVKRLHNHQAAKKASKLLFQTWSKQIQAVVILCEQSCFISVQFYKMLFFFISFFWSWHSIYKCKYE